VTLKWVGFDLKRVTDSRKDDFRDGLILDAMG
jgi:hypothetical protein